jgi:hypothetical protein
MARQEEIGGYEYYIYELGDLANKKERRDGRWRVARALNQKMVYFGCPSCNKICQLELRFVTKEGLTRHAACGDCDSTWRLKFAYWEEFLEEQKKGG